MDMYPGEGVYHLLVRISVVVRALDWPKIKVTKNVRSGSGFFFQFIVEHVKTTIEHTVSLSAHPISRI